MIRVY